MKTKIRIPLATKLIFMTALIISAMVAFIAWNNNEVFLAEYGRSQDETNSELANTKAVEVNGVIEKYLEKTRLLAHVMTQNFTRPEEKKRVLDAALVGDLDIVNIELYRMNEGQLKFVQGETNENHLRSYDLDRDFIKRLRTEVSFPLAELFADKDKVHIQNSTIQGGMPLLSLGVGLPDDLGIVRFVALVDIRLDRLQQGFALGGARTLFLIDSQGKVLAHSDEKLALGGHSLSESPIVQEAMAHGDLVKRGRKPSYLDPEAGEKMVGAYAKTDFGPTVIVQTPLKKALAPAENLLRETLATALKFLFIPILPFVWLGAMLVSWAIERLHEHMIEVAHGNFDVRAHIKTGDEVEDLADGFNEMVGGLKERDKVKNILNKFHGSSITDDLLKSDLNLGGSRKDVTVFFSDIRDFTKFSEGHTPEEVVEMLNEYFQIMVGIIVASGGIVDKFVGDAIMAVWGAPRSTGDDPASAVKASLEMRVALNELNERRIARGQGPIKIGMGLHTGPAISGTIGSTERMEYTVIGDTVNMASRIESSTKAFGADLLISETVAKSVESRFILDLVGAAEVKGKSEPIKMYKVRGHIANDGTHSLIQTPYSDYEAGHADKVKVA